MVNNSLDCYKPNYKCPDAKHMSTINTLYLRAWLELRSLSEGPLGTVYAQKLNLTEQDLGIFAQFELIHRDLQRREQERRAQSNRTHTARNIARGKRI